MIKKPSMAILMLLKGICIILDVEAKKIKKEGAYAEYEEDWWTPATSNKVLGNGRFTETLIGLDPEAFNEEQIARLQEVTEDPEFNVQAIKRASKAAPQIYNWLLAVQNYYFVHVEAVPRRERLEQHEVLLK
mmetsp:Transcript_12587/g.19597  ORF Transcript_12587/g.19597 Transcript_12587/m.19597 type:complete len:132 (+) Transcript_12587:1006-1401(+)